MKDAADWAGVHERSWRRWECEGAPVPIAVRDAVLESVRSQKEMRGERMWLLRTGAGLTLEDVAAGFGCSTYTAWKLDHDNFPPRDYCRWLVKYVSSMRRHGR